MNLNYIVVSIFSIIIFSCNKKSETTGDEKDSTEVVADTLARNSVVVVDSSKLVKAFDDIYFGGDGPRFISYDKYEIDNRYYEFDSGYAEIHPKYGLYQFLLASYFKQSNKGCIKDIERLKLIINKKYGNPVKISSKPAPKTYNLIEQGIINAEEKTGTKRTYAPPDDRYINYLYVWKKNDINIKVGIRTQYSYFDNRGYMIRSSDDKHSSFSQIDTINGEYVKEQKVVLLFTYQKVINMLNIQENNFKKDSINKKKQNLKLDAKKF